MLSIPEYLKKEHHIVLNPQQITAVESKEQKVLLLAVPGSGKTTVLVSRAAHLILNEHAAPERMLILTFSRESARDMKRRFEHLFGKIFSEIPRFSTIHSFCYRVLRQYAKQYHRSFPKIMEEQKAILLRQIYQQVNGEYLTEDLLESLANDIGLVKNRMLSREDLLNYENSTDHFSKILEQYDQIKKENGLMDYDDMLVFAYDIMKKVPSVLNRIKQSYDYIMMDEVQDTSKLQHELIRLLGNDIGIFMVGDEDQCIYAFRGADPEGMMQLEQYYSHAKVLKIEQNYRSNRDLVCAANRFIQLNQMRYSKQMFCDNERVNSICTVALQDYSEQYETLLEMISKETGTTAVLYRNNESVIPVLDLLIARQIPFDIRDYKLRFFTSFVVRDLIAYLKLSQNPNDLDSFEQIYYKCGCSKAIYQYVRNHDSSYSSVFDAAADSPDTSYFLRKKLVGYHRILNKIRNQTPRKALDSVEDRLEYRDYLDRKAGSGINRVNTSLKITIMKSLAGRHKSIEEFLHALSLLQQKLSQSPERLPDCRLTLSSVHSGKGLEFDTVFLLDMIDGVLPSKQALDDLEYEQRDEWEGEVRLFYVAVTRARNKLVAFTSDYCNDQQVSPSRFLTYYLRKSKDLIPDKTEDHVATAIRQGTKVYHRFFGNGVVTSAVSDNLKIHFEHFGNKELSCRFCFKNKLLWIISEKDSHK